jgi:hypothetical protein
MADGSVVWRAWALCSDKSKVVLTIPVVMLAINTGALSSLLLTLFYLHDLSFFLIYSSHLSVDGHGEGNRVRFRTSRGKWDRFPQSHAHWHPNYSSVALRVNQLFCDVHHMSQGMVRPCRFRKRFVDCLD